MKVSVDVAFDRLDPRRSEWLSVWDTQQVIGGSKDDFRHDFQVIFRIPGFDGREVAMATCWQRLALRGAVVNCWLLVAGWLDVFAPNLAINVVL